MSEEERESVLIVGGGIAGITAALNVADYGYKAYLVDDTPSIGGLMARLDKTFPTNDCSICIEAPLMYEVNTRQHSDCGQCRCEEGGSRERALQGARAEAGHLRR